MDAYIVFAPSGACFIGLSDGPNGNIINLHHPQRYREMIQQDKPAEVRFAITNPLRAFDMEKLTIRFESYASKDHMGQDAYRELLRVVSDVIERRAMQRSGIVKPDQMPSPAEMAKLQEAIRNKVSQGG